MKCERCGIGGVVLPFGAGDYTWLHHECWKRWRDAGFPSLRQAGKSSNQIDQAVEEHCRRAFASWESFDEDDKRHWRSIYQPILRGNQNAVQLATLVA